MTGPAIRLAVDIGGTFTDLVLAAGDRLTTAKVLTTPEAPEEGVMAGVELVLGEAGVEAAAVQLLIHGTTLATNAIIERKGARTALIVTEGHRDALEMAYENRFAQYDLMADRPRPLVSRALRWTVRERLNWRGEVLIPLDEATVEALLPRIEHERIESIAVGLLHSYANAQHECRVADIIRGAFPSLSMSLSSEICPEIREYDRQSTTCANAYVQPKMARYLEALAERVRARGLTCPFFLMTSGGGIATLETAVEPPDPPCRIGSRRRRHSCQPGGPRLRPGPGPLLRHGRHDGEDLPHRRWQASPLPPLRGGPGLSLHEGQRAAA